jgi:predicted ATPase
MAKKIVITGGPSTGKTTLINHLALKGFRCFEEISRKITREARDEGIEHFFLEDPLRFSEKILNARTEQYMASDTITEPCVFLDRGIPDVLAYMDFADQQYPEEFVQKCLTHRYDAVFVLKPWLEIYANDNERYESFEEAKEIHSHLMQTYSRFNYQILQLPEDTVEKRIEFMLEYLNL